MKTWLIYVCKVSVVNLSAKSDPQQTEHQEMRKYGQGDTVHRSALSTGVRIATEWEREPETEMKQK